MEKSKCKWCKTPYETHGPLGLFSSSFCCKKCEHEYNQIILGSSTHKESSINNENENNSQDSKDRYAMMIGGPIVTLFGIGLMIAGEPNAIWGGAVISLFGLAYRSTLGKNFMKNTKYFLCLRLSGS